MIAAIIQARLGSTRFPRKVLAPLCGKPVLAHVIERAALIKGIDCVVVAGGGEPFSIETSPPVRWLFPDISEADVLGRYALVAEEIGADVIVRITGDCPLLDPHLAGLVLEGLLRAPPGMRIDYTSNIFPRRSWPDGLDVEAFPLEILREANRQATEPYDREHVTPWIQRYAADRLPVLPARVIAWGWECVSLPVDWSWLRLTVDTEEDLAWLETVMRARTSGAPALSR